MLTAVVARSNISAPYGISVLSLRRGADMADLTFTVKIPGTFFRGGSIEDAFHGTTEAAAKSILKRGFVVPEKPTTEYGSGVYFFEGDYLAALWWARGVCRHLGYDEGNSAVIQAEVDLGRTFFVNVMGEQLEAIRNTLTEWYGESWEPEDVLRLIGDELRNQGKIDSIKAVRRAKKTWEEPHRFRAEVVVLVFDPKRIKPARIHMATDLESGWSLEFTNEAANDESHD